jgi:hypothetical protein
LAEATFLRKAPSLKATVVTAVLATAGRSGMMNTPTAQNIAGLSPSGNVTITEDFVIAWWRQRHPGVPGTDLSV